MTGWPICEPSGLMSRLMIRYLLSRTGCLMLLAGSIFIIIGAAAIRSDQPGFDILIVGLVLFSVGFLFWNRWRSKERKSTRFSKFRKNPGEEDRKGKEEGVSWEDRFDE